MALTVLGTKNVWLEDNWLEFDSLFLSNNRRYHLEMLIKPLSDTIDFTVFKVGYSYKLKKGSIVQRILSNDYRIENRVIGIVIDIPSIVDKGMPVKFFIKRLTRVDIPSQVAKVAITLALDPDGDY